MPPKVSRAQKALQKQFYSFIGSNWGIAILVIGCFWIFNSVLQILQVVVQQGDPHRAHLHSPTPRAPAQPE